MKKLAYWSKQNVVKARIIIGISHFILVVLGIAAGVFSYFENIFISGGFLFLMCGIFSVAYLFYPDRRSKSGAFKYSFNRRFKHDVVLVLASTCVIFAGVNQFAFQPMQTTASPLPVSFMIATGNTIEIPLMKKEIRKGLTAKIKEVRANIKQELRSMKAQRSETGGNKAGLKVFLIFLTVLMAVGLFALIGSLACNLSCAGHEGAAWVVLIGGTAGIIWLSVVLIGAILRMGGVKKIRHEEKRTVPDPT